MVADVGVSYVNTWLAFNLLPTVILLEVLKQKLCHVQENRISNTSCDFAYEPDICTKFLIFLLNFYSIEKNLPLISAELHTSVVQVSSPWPVILVT